MLFVPFYASINACSFFLLLELMSGLQCQANINLLSSLPLVRASYCNRTSTYRTVYGHDLSFWTVYIPGQFLLVVIANPPSALTCACVTHRADAH